MAIRPDDLLVLAEVARSGSLLRAAEALEVDHTTVSRRLAALDRQMGSPTVTRTSTGTRLTELGEALLASATRIEAAVQEAERLSSAGLRDGHLSGLLRVSSVEGFGAVFVTPAIARLQRAHPRLQVELVTGTRPITQAAAADIEISVGQPERRRARNLRLAKYHMGLYATQEYLDEHGPIPTPAALRAHPLVYYVETMMRIEQLVVIEKHFPDATIGFGSPNVFAQVAATAAGAGVGVLPAFLARREPRLQRVLADEVAIGFEFWVSIVDRPATAAAASALLQELGREVAVRRDELLLPSGAR